jgi:3-deoxy-D-manno-octulosonate 8-phosphate phosphatase (KDO 8-P phosphatase)
LSRPSDDSSAVGAAAHIKLMLFDVDGVLTDGKIVLHADGTESKRFDIRDGIAMVWAQRAGVRVGFLSARHSAVTTHRAAQLGITLVHNGVPVNKLETYLEILREFHLTDAEVAYMGDDILDLPVLSRAGLSAAPADAVDEVRAHVRFVTRRAGGEGAARELVELVLRAQGKWDPLVDGFLQLQEAAAARKDAAVTP